MNECLIDFDPYPQCPTWYNNGDTKFNGFNEVEDFFDLYEQAEELRLENRKLFLRLAMCERLLSDDESAEAHDFGLTLSHGDYKLLTDLWFNQRRLLALKKGRLLA